MAKNTFTAEVTFKLKNLKFRIFICAIFEFLTFQMLINLNLKFNVQCVVFLQFLLHFQHDHLAGSLSKETLKKKSNFLMLTKRQGKVADS